MHRLFVAIRPPAPICARLLAAMGGISGARWQTEEQLHLTVRFIGEVDSHCADDIRAALGTVVSPDFEIALAGVGAFERRGRPETLWAGVAPHAPLQALHRKTDYALAGAGIPPDSRSYAPHITLARLSRAAGAIDSFLQAAALLSSPEFPVEHFGLYESHLGSLGSLYSLVERYPLAN